MDGTLLTPPGQPIQPEEISVPKARDLVKLLRSGHLAHVEFVEARRAQDGDVVVFDVEPEVPQHPVAPIALVERIAVTFYDDDHRMPETGALRKDFPRDVPHLNLRPSAYPWASLCLYAEQYDDLKLRWTAAGYVRRVHEWLSKTARGELHEGDQPLEPFIIPSALTLVLPQDLLQGASEGRELVIYRTLAKDDRVFVARWRGPRDGDSPVFRTALIVTEPRVHGVIHQQPRNVEELHSLLEPLGVDLLSLLRERLRTLPADEATQAARLAIIAIIPQTRREGAQPERNEIWVFVTLAQIRDIGAALGLWTLEPGGVRAALVQPDLERRGREIVLELLGPVFELSREYAAKLSGVTPGTPRIVAVGAGALGSQVINNAIRTGWGGWTIVDDDHLLPHNLVRHLLTGTAVGVPKATAVAMMINDLFDSEEVAQDIVANVLRSEEHEQLKNALAEAELILDMSASPTVNRHLAADVESSARRFSLFLNPAGTDLVLLAEDAERRIRLDDLEMQYYREVIRNELLADHLRRNGQRLRYGRSCRDVTVSIPQDRLAIAGGIGARAIRLAAEAQEARISLWRLRADLGVDNLTVPVYRVQVADREGWQIRYDEGLAERMFSLRAERLPNETGGVLIGHWDMHRRILYIVDALAAPPDSEERPIFFQRGSKGLRAEIDDIGSKTAGALVYVGEWHSHPDGHGLDPSADDQKVLAWLREKLAPEGLPTVMIIVGNGDLAIHFAGAS